MNKLFTKIAAACVTAAMAVGVGVAISEGQKEATRANAAGATHALFDVSTASNWETGNTTYSSTVWTSNGCQFSYAANNNKAWAYARLGGKGGTFDAYVGTTSSTTYSVASLDISVVAIYATSTVKVNSVTLKVWGSFSASAWSSLRDTVDLTDDFEVGTVNAIPTSGDSWASGSYFQLIVNYTNTTSSNRGVDISKIIANEPASSSYVTDVTLTSDKNSISGGIFGLSNATLTPTVTYADSSTNQMVDYSVTDTNTYSASSTSTKASVIGNVLSFTQNGTVYVWATSKDFGNDGVTKVHSTSVSVTATGLYAGIEITATELELGNAYADFEKTIGGVTFSGNAMKGSGNIQMKNASPSGIVTTTTGGLIKYLYVEVGNGTGAFYINGKTTSSYAGAGDLYSSSTRGETIGGTSYSATTGIIDLTASTYQYFGIKGQAAIYLSRIVVAYEPVLPTSISLSGESTISIGSTVTITPTLTNSSGYVVSETGLTWTVDDYSVLQIMSAGVFKGLAAGTAVITATSKADNTVYQTHTITVGSGSIPVSSITISPDINSVYVGESVQLTATVLPEGATDKTVTWSSDDTDVITIDQTGLATAVGAGEAEITATANDGSGVEGIALFEVSAFTYAKATSINGGDKVIFAYEGESSNNYLSGISTTSTKYGLATDYSYFPGTDYVFDVVAGVDDGSVAFKNSSGKYLVWTSGNSLNVSDTLNDHSSWTISFTDGIATIINLSTVEAEAQRYLSYNTSNPRYACYETDYSNITIWKLNGTAGEADALAYASSSDGFMKDIGTDICYPYDESTFASAMTEAWADYEAVYELLSDEAKAYIASKSGNASGNDVEKMIDLYNYIYGKYGETLSLSNFLGRVEAVKGSVSLANSFLAVVNTQATTAIIVVVALTSVTAIGAIFFIKRRKYN